ncbi:hypothetical protein CYLTODRAFT_174195 [Cylindrobasidium torrendii FP15055 ss-10]|uniref:DUF6534 domain-containing protein n=1 Tax=Cylindrobasidium torrendii FP15055 ss-10 TaxID=1314674 RepID=A0A0D7AWA4_9AGAR|nr:hypothetical protein CYLTODRAFT_174195 [Cylindrobasidium torrendii FP15055 ss-10]
MLSALLAVDFYVSAIVRYVASVASIQDEEGITFYLVEDSNYDATATWDWMFAAAQPAMTGIIAGAVQLFFSWRVKLLTHNIFIGIVLALGSLTSTGASLYIAYLISIPENSMPLASFKSVACVWMATASIVDVTITTSLVMYLRNHKTGIAETDMIVDRIIRLAIQTGMVTSICAITGLILFLVVRSHEHFIFNFILPKLYTNMLLTSLNSRVAWTAREPGEVDMTWNCARDTQAATLAGTRCTYSTGDRFPSA